MNEKFLDWSKLEELPDDESCVTEKLKFVSWKDGKHCRKRKECWLPARTFTGIHTMLSCRYPSHHG